MKLVSLQLQGYRQFLEPLHIEFPDGLTGICGPNGVGKSKLIEAIGFALYGPTASVLPPGDRKRDLPTHGVENPATRVELRVEVRGQTLRAVRTPSTASLEVEGGGVLADTPSGVTRKVIELLRLSPGAYMGTFVAAQREVAGLLDQSPQDRTRLVNRMVGISQIETAIRLAHDERVRREQAATIAEGLITTSVEEAASRKEEASTLARLAENEAQSAERALTIAEVSLEAVRKGASEVQLAEQRLIALHDQLSEQREHVESLEQQIRGVEERIVASREATHRTETATQVLTLTEGVAGELQVQESLRRSVEVAEQLEDVRRERERLRAQADMREDLLTEASEVATRVKAATDAVLRGREELSARGQEVETAMNTLATVRRQEDQAKALGETGVCQVCGQRFGAAFTQALHHFAKEIADAEAQIDLLVAAQSSLHAVVEGLEEEERQVASAHDDLVRRIAEFAEVAGRLVTTEARFHALAEELNQSAGAYDPARHAALIAMVNARDAAERTIAQLSNSVADEPTALALRSELEQRKSEVEQRRAEGVAERESLLLVTSEGQAKARALEAATELEATLRDDWSDSRLVVAGRQRDLGEAEENLVAAQRRSHAYGLARRALIVGERTDQLLSRLLTDVTAEARPRISELMDTWARSLLSGRFTSLALAEDYRIRADNGSGEHDLGHFSGGEQTLLSVILRVSISLFCRERAGFDTGFLILDEVFGDQDADHRLLLLEFLDEIQREYHQVLVVNHVEDVTAILDSIIEVRRTGPNTSTASIRDG